VHQVVQHYHRLVLGKKQGYAAFCINVALVLRDQSVVSNLHSFVHGLRNNMFALGYEVIIIL
jgi:hypothetical protein